LEHGSRVFAKRWDARELASVGIAKSASEGSHVGGSSAERVHHTSFKVQVWSPAVAQSRAARLVLPPAPLWRFAHRSLNTTIARCGEYNCSGRRQALKQEQCSTNQPRQNVPTPSALTFTVAPPAKYRMCRGCMLDQPGSTSSSGLDCSRARPTNGSEESPSTCSAC
jgi:hypothetical protein